MTGLLWEHSGVSGWKLKGVLGASVHLNVQRGFGRAGSDPAPGERRWTGRLLRGLWKVSQNQHVSPDCFGFHQVAFSDKNLFFFSEEPQPVAPGIPELCPQLCRRRRRFWLGAPHCGIRALMFMSGNQSLHFESRKMTLGHIVGVCRGLMFTGCFGNAVASSL